MVGVESDWPGIEDSKRRWKFETDTCLNELKFYDFLNELIIILGNFNFIEETDCALGKSVCLG